MEVDPQHPKDDFVRLIRGIVIGPDELEALTAEGWQPFAQLDRNALIAMMPRLEGLPKRSSRSGGHVRHQRKPLDKNRKQGHGKQQRRHMQSTIDEGLELAKQWDSLDEDWESEDEYDEDWERDDDEY